MSDAKPEFDAMIELGRLLEEGDFNVRLFGVPVAGPQARSLKAAIDARIAAAVAAEREACAKLCDPQEPDEKSDEADVARDCAAAIRARGGEVARETECRCGHSHAAHKGTGYSCLGSASPRESCDCRLFVKRGSR